MYVLLISVFILFSILLIVLFFTLFVVSKNDDELEIIKEPRDEKKKK